MKLEVEISNRLRNNNESWQFHLWSYSYIVLQMSRNKLELGWIIYRFSWLDKKQKRSNKNDNKCIVCIGVSPPPQKHPPLFLAKPPLKSANCPSPPFRQSPLYVSFYELAPQVEEGWHYLVVQKLSAFLRGVTSKHDHDFHFLKIVFIWLEQKAN